MSSIIPISRLQEDPYAISRKCHSQKEPIFITKDGYGDMVLLSFDSYEELKLQADQKAAINKINTSNVDVDFNSNSSSDYSGSSDSPGDSADPTKSDFEKLPIEDVLKILKQEVEKQYNKNKDYTNR